jgi:predicted TIM-barrel fold metal-dependent hydrolase
MTTNTEQSGRRHDDDDRTAWHARREEEVIEPDLPICDAHHHLWDVPNARYLLPELLADIGSGHNVEMTVFVECRAFYRGDGPAELRPVGETEFVNGAAAMAASGRYGRARACAGIVGYADLTHGSAVESVLAEHVASASRRFRSIRHAAAWDASDEVRNSHTNPPHELYRQSRFRDGFAKLRQFKLGFDALVYAPQLGDVIDLARSFPDQPIVLNHVGGPLGIGPYRGKESENFALWKQAMRDLGACASVYVKLGGLGMKIRGFDFHKQPAPPSSKELAAAWRPYIETCIDIFGARRCMFESNFPVDKVSCAYAVLWNAFKRITAGASPEEKAALFRDTAMRFYRLDAPPLATLNR